MSKPKKSDRHGHVARNQQGLLARCGGTWLCEHCRQEVIAHIGPTRGGWYAEARDRNAMVDAPQEVVLWSLRTAELALELAKVSAALRDVLDATGRWKASDAEQARARAHAEEVLVEVEVEKG